MALFTSVFVISTLYAFMASGIVPVIAASDADSAFTAFMAFPLIACSTIVARIGAGATAPRAILAFWQTPPSIVLTDATLTMVPSGVGVTVGVAVGSGVLVGALVGVGVGAAGDTDLFQKPDRIL